jgi:hypothetical protein
LTSAVGREEVVMASGGAGATVSMMVVDTVAGEAAESVTEIITVKLPLWVGVPEMVTVVVAEAALDDSPVGNPETVQWYGVVPPPAVTVPVYGWPAVPEEGTATFVKPRATLIAMVMDIVSLGLPLSTAVTITVGSLDAVTRPATDAPLRSFVRPVGVPEKTPVLLNIIPVGRPMALHVIGGVPPESAGAKLQLNAVPAVAPRVTVPLALAALQLGELAESCETTWLGAGKLGVALTLKVSGAADDFVESAMEVAVMLTEPGELGAVKVAMQVLQFVVVLGKLVLAHAAAVPPLGVNMQVQVTPLLLESFATVAVTVSICPASSPGLEAVGAITLIGSGAAGGRAAFSQPASRPAASKHTPSATSFFMAFFSPASPPRDRAGSLLTGEDRANPKRSKPHGRVR